MVLTLLLILGSPEVKTLLTLAACRAAWSMDAREKPSGVSGEEKTSMVLTRGVRKRFNKLPVAPLNDPAATDLIELSGFVRPTELA